MTLLNCAKDDKNVYAAVSILSLPNLKANSVGEARVFLENTAITDNSDLLSNSGDSRASTVANIQEKEDLAWPTVKWGFSTGCKIKPGVFIIFDALEEELPTIRLESSNAKIYYIDDDKLVFEPLVRGEGLTSDSYYQQLCSGFFQVGYKTGHLFRNTGGGHC